MLLTALNCRQLSQGLQPWNWLVWLKYTCCENHLLNSLSTERRLLLRSLPTLTLLPSCALRRCRHDEHRIRDCARAASVSLQY